MRSARPWVYAVLVLALALHNDLWLWDDSGFLLGLPVGLSYHLLFCGVVSVVLALLVAADPPGRASGE